MEPIHPDPIERSHRVSPQRAANGPLARLDTSLELLLERAPAIPAGSVLATVVATAGSTYRKPGARMLLLEDGSSIGLLSGGCLESDLALHARGVVEDGVARAVEYEMRGPDDVLFGIGAGCEGSMRILLEPAGMEHRVAEALRAAAALTQSGEPALLVVVHESDRWPLGTYPSAAVPEPLRASFALALAERASREIVIDRGRERLRAFIDVIAPTPHLLLCGGGPDAQPVSAVARSLGWRVTVVDHRPAYARPERFPGARVALAPAAALGATVALADCHAAVVMSHHLPSDVTYLRELAAAGAPGYVGLLGPGARRQRITEELGAVADALHTRLRGPVGLDLGAQTPEAIALAIVSEVHAYLAHRRGLFETRETLTPFPGQ